MSVLSSARAVVAAWCYAWFGAAVLSAATVRAEPAVAYPFIRTVYVEETGSPAAWWANPALAARADVPVLLTANAGPVGRLYTVSSVRFLAPLRCGLRVGVGVSAFGAAQSDTFRATESGADYRGRFVFSRPDFEIGAAYPFTYAGSVGILLKGGLEAVDVGTGQTDNCAVVGISAGWVSPTVGRLATFSIAGQWTGHFWHEPFWENEGKVGLRVSLPDDLVAVDVTYADRLPALLCLEPSASAWRYRAAKAMLSVRVSRLLALLAGASSDFRTADNHNGTCVHAGATLLPSATMPFVGGYDLGVSVNERWHFLHRFWMGYRIRPGGLGGD